MMDMHVPRQIRSFEIKAQSKPSGVGGGDVVRHYSIADWDLIILVDIAGHDETSSYLAQGLLGLMGGVSRYSRPSGPADFLFAVAETVCSDPAFAATQASAVALGLYDHGIVRIAGAGHPPVVERKGSAVTLYPSQAPMFGLPVAAPAQETVVTLDPGHQLFIFSDGVAESEADIRRIFAETRSVNLFDTIVSETATDDRSLVMVERVSGHPL